MFLEIFVSMVVFLMGIFLIHIFLGPRLIQIPNSCEKLRKEALDAAKRYEKLRKAVLKLINKYQKLKKQVEELKKKKRDCDAEYQKQEDKFNEDSVHTGSGVEAWREKKRKQKQALRKKKEECEELQKKLKKKKEELKNVKETLSAGLMLESISRDHYPKLYAKFRKCLKKHSGIKEPLPKEKSKPCCSSGVRIGLVAREGGEVAIGGLEAGVVHVFCMDNPDVTATLKWRGIRVGPGLGGELGLELIVFSGPKYPCQLEDQVANVMGGLGFDISAGVKIGDYFEGLAKGGIALPKALRGVGGTDKKFKALVEFFKGNSVAAKKAKEAFAGLGSSAASSGFTGITFPIPPAGAGLNIGLWWTFPETCQLVRWTGCPECDGKK